MPRRVAIIIERTETALGGAERSMLEVASALSDAGWRVDLLTAKGVGQGQNIRVLCRDVPGKRVPLAVFAQALREHLAHTSYDIVHSVLPLDVADVYQPRGGTYAESLIRHAASYPSRSLRWYKRATARANMRRARLLRAERTLCRRPDGPGIAALSNYVVEQLKKHYGTDPQRIRLILNGVATGRPPDRRAVQRIRARLVQRLALAETDNPLLLLFAAHNFRLKGLDPLIRALAVARNMAAERSPCLIVLGAGKSDRYRRRARRLGVERRIAFLGPAENVQDALSISDVGVLPTFYDPSSRFILEALAAGKPVITTAFNGAADHFTNNRHGIVVNSPNDTQALAEAIAHFTQTTNVTAAAEAIASDKLTDAISIRRVARELSAYYETILEQKKHVR